MPPVIPLATYRVQLTADFGFDAAAAIVPYLKTLGITHLYASPFLKARAGSTHGYDIVDHTAINPELGGEEAFARLSAALRKEDMGLILDFVPNHMGVHYADNSWWLEILEWGPRSRFADFFDVDWDTLPQRPHGGVLLPILGKSYGEALEAGEIELRYDAQEGSFSAWYFEHRLPIFPRRYSEILTAIVSAANAQQESAGTALLDIAQRYSGPRKPRYAESAALKEALANVDGGAEVIERGLSVYRPKAGDPSSALSLHLLLERQFYRLAHWRLAGTEINYRRFFDINSLAGLRVEDPDTFQAIHPRVARMIGEGQLQGLRLDHIDGLRDPAQYCRRLQRLIRGALGESTRFYVVVEKILGEKESAPNLPGVASTTGYEWLNVISQLLLQGSGLPILDRIWAQISPDDRDLAEVLLRTKNRVLETLLASEFNVLARLLARIAAGHYSTRDYSETRLREALKWFVLYFPIYRSYVTAAGLSGEDRKTIQSAIERARGRWFGADIAIFDFLQAAITLDLIGPGHRGHSNSRVRRFAAKLQQFTGPMMAKSLEDTAFYRYHRLLALNEVGGHPAAPAMTTEEFHTRMRKRVDQSPNGMTATATHDTKRGEDARARILALGELAEEWEPLVQQWREMNAACKNEVGGIQAPTRAHEYMLYQALIGVWPLEGVSQDFVSRMQAYAIKAAREGKRETSWLNPNEGYEQSLQDFIAGILDSARSERFLESFAGFAQRTALLGALNSLSQVTLKALMPGVPDFYQGTEMWDLSLVDPDNRRPVDFAQRREWLAQTTPYDWRALAGDWRSGAIKLALTQRLLAFRNAMPSVLSHGSYRPIEVTGTDRDRVIAFARISGRDALIVAVSRHFAGATQGGRRWPDTFAARGELSLGGLKLSRNLLQPDAPATPHLDRLFGPLPLAVVSARMEMSASSPSSTRGRSRQPELSALSRG